MVKATINGSNKKATYPKLMLSIQTGGVVLFNSKDCGMLVAGGNVGYYSSNWDESYFRDFTGSLILSNEG